MAALPLWYLLVLFTTLGAIWGSFVGALCSRWPQGESIANGRSRCDNCGEVVAAYDLIPVFSYLNLQGKCRTCRHNIGIGAIAIELASGLIGAVTIVTMSLTQASAAAVFGWLLLPLVILDYRHYWLPDRLTLVLGVLGLLAGPSLTPQISWFDRAIGGVAGFAILEAVRRVYGWSRQREGMGAGDPKLFAAIGIWLGWESLPMVLLLTTILGLAMVMTDRLTVKKHDSALPFGSFLAIASFMISWIGWIPN